MVKRTKLQPLDANLLRPAALDLFGEVPVSQRELMLWMWKVPYWMTRWAPLRRVHGYIKSWDVAGKIRAAKLSGRLPEILGDEACPHCGVLLEMNYQEQIDRLLIEVHPRLVQNANDANFIADGPINDGVRESLQNAFTRSALSWPVQYRPSDKPFGRADNDAEGHFGDVQRDSLGIVDNDPVSVSLRPNRPVKPPLHASA